MHTLDEVIEDEAIKRVISQPKYRNKGITYKVGLYGFALVLDCDGTRHIYRNQDGEYEFFFSYDLGN